MIIPAEFDSIRPFEAEELPAVYDRLAADAQFRQVVQYLYPQVPFEAVVQQMKGCKTCLDFQKTFCYPFLKQLMAQASTGFDIDVASIDVSRRYTFVSNHRDIVLDSALLDVLLIDAGAQTTCEIAIGDNLLAAPWIKDLVRINKSFIVERSLGIREMLAASKRLSEYMHFVVGEKHDNVWIAQREGRAKDSDDRTQPSILKMMAMGGEGSVIDRLKALHIVPLAISYEYDPCDFLKAREFQLKRDVEGWKKTKADDVESMRTGIMGYKGRVHYHCAPCIDEWLDTLPHDMPKGELFDAIAAHIDQEIHRHYRIYATNRVAAGADSTPEEQAAFDRYIDGQLAKIQLDAPDRDFLRERLVTMYANPYRNKKRNE
ncbi:MAG: 1-acyl-sn-glycerol-3-phosphate acyltransferase [Prevotella sp.]|nr:1-acyl-sn-glycerol-3-phosphate acyltransferase [Bacteroidaceae bacterium]MBR1415239.1 1-acyl-sn-glycerol-3-phosphate acyltransferase [Prevotella sp.]